MLSVGKANLQLSLFLHCHWFTSVCFRHNLVFIKRCFFTDLISFHGLYDNIHNVYSNEQVKSDSSFLDSKTPDVFSFTITGLQGITEKHGPKSAQADDASNLVTSFIHKVVYFSPVYIKTSAVLIDHWLECTLFFKEPLVVGLAKMAE